MEAGDVKVSEGRGGEPYPVATATRSAFPLWIPQIPWGGGFSLMCVGGFVDVVEPQALRGLGGAMTVHGSVRSTTRKDDRDK